MAGSEPHLRHHNFQSFNAWQPSTPGGKRHAMPQEVLMQIAIESDEGGRAECECCGSSYSMNLGGMKLTKVSSFKEAMLCKWCRKENNLS